MQQQPDQDACPVCGNTDLILHKNLKSGQTRIVCGLCTHVSGWYMYQIDAWAEFLQKKFESEADRKARALEWLDNLRNEGS